MKNNKPSVGTRNSKRGAPVKNDISKLPTADQYCRLAPLMAPAITDADRQAVARLAELALARDMSVDGAVLRLLSRLFNMAWKLSTGLEFPVTLALRMPGKKTPPLMVVQGIRLQRARDNEAASAHGLSLWAHGNPMHPDATPCSTQSQEVAVTEFLFEGLDVSVRNLAGQWSAPRFEPRLSGELLELLRNVRQWQECLEAGQALPRTELNPVCLSIEQMTDGQGLVAGVAPALLARAAKDISQRYVTVSSMAKLLGCPESQAQVVLDAMYSAGWVRLLMSVGPYEINAEVWKELRALDGGQ